MRVGVVTTSFPRYPGDPAGSFVAGHAAYLAARGREVEVIAAGDREGAPEPGAAGGPPGVEVVRVAAPDGLFYRGGAPDALERSLASWPGALRFSAALVGAVRRRSARWEAVVAHWLAPPALAAAAATPKPLLAVAHGGDVHLLLRTGAALPAAALLCARRARVAFVSRRLRDRFLGALPRPLARSLGARAFVCPPGLDLERFRRLRRPAPGEGPAQRATVLFLGRLVPIKGADLAVEAAARWRVPARLVIAGAGPEERGLRERAARLGAPVTFAGEVNGAARDRLLASADLLLVSSRPLRGRAEGMPRAALEAMAAGVPVVAASIGGLAELPVTKVPPEDPSALAGAIERLLADPAGRAEQSAIQMRFVRPFDWSRVGPRLEPSA